MNGGTHNPVDFWKGIIIIAGVLLILWAIRKMFGGK
jgi:hypothetical protein